jgi:cytochrome c
MTRDARTIAIAAVSASLACACGPSPQDPPRVAGGDAERGRVALERYACGACHVVPGVRAARGRVGPVLADYGRRVYVAGKYPNEPDLLIAWIRNPPALSPESAMPDVGVTADDARDIAAYLYALE